MTCGSGSVLAAELVPPQPRGGEDHREEGDAGARVRRAR